MALERFFLHLYDYLRPRRMVAAIVVLAVVACAIVLAWRMNYEEDIARFLPHDKQSERWADVYESLSAGGQIAIVVRGDNTDTIEAAMDCLKEQLEQLDTQQMIERLQVQADETQWLEMAQFVGSNAPYFLSPADWQRIDSLIQMPGYIARQISDDKQLLQLPTAAAMATTMRQDPLQLFTPVVKRLQAFRLSEQFSLVDGYVFTSDGRAALAFLTSPYGNSESAHNDELQQLLDQAMTRTAENHPSVSVSAVGASLIAAGNARQIKTDSTLAMSVAVVLIVALLAWHYRRLSFLLWIVVSIAFGWLFAVASMSLLAHHVSVIVIGVGSVFIGIAVNYPLHYLDHLQTVGNSRQALRDMVEPLLIGSVTTVSAFLCLLWLDAAAMRDLGLFGALMLLSTILFVLIVLPLKNFNPIHPTSPTLPTSPTVPTFPLPSFTRKFLLGLLCLLTLIFFWASLDTSFDSDLHHINYTTAQQQTDLELLSQLQGEASVYAVSEAADLETALRQNETQVLPLLERLQAQGVVSRVSGLGGFLPSMEQQQERAQQWNSFWARWRGEVDRIVRQEARAQGFSDSAFEPFLDMIAQTIEPQPPVYFDLILANMGDTYIQHGRNGSVRIVNMVQTTAPGQVTSLIGQEAQSPVYAFSSSDVGSQLVKLLSDSFNYIGFVCGFVVFFFLWLSFGRLELSLLSFLPLAVGWVWILGIMQLTGLQFNIVNIILATFIFGQGDDYTIFMTEGLITQLSTGQSHLHGYKRSVALSATIMFVGIGTLIMARHPALRSLAQVTIIGMATVVLMAFVLPPLVFHWLTRQRDGQLRQVPVTLAQLGRSLLVSLLFLAFMYLFLLPYTWLYFHLGRHSHAHSLCYHCLLQRIACFIVHHLPGVGFRLDNQAGEDFSRPAVIICNHQSQLDLMCLMMLTPRIVFLTNDWVWHHPVYGAVVRRAEYYPVSQGLEPHLEQLRRLYQRGYSIAVFPEGTRSADCSILRFHKGAFYLAEQLKAPLLPVVLHGAGHVLPKHELLLRRGSIHVEVGQRIVPGHPLWKENLFVRTKTFRHYYQERYAQLRQRLETPEYLAHYVRCQYMYRGPEIERRARRFVCLAVGQLQEEQYSGNIIRISDPGQGEKALMVALMHPQAQVYATLSSRKDWLVATHLAAVPGNLHFLTQGVS